MGAVMNNQGKVVPETGWFPVSGSSGGLNLPTLQTRSASPKKSSSEPRSISYGDDWRRAPQTPSSGSRKQPTAAVNSFSPYRDVAQKAKAMEDDLEDMAPVASVASSRIGVLPGSFVSNVKKPPSGPVPPPITVFPNDTIVIHYATLDLPDAQRSYQKLDIMFIEISVILSGIVPDFRVKEWLSCVFSAKQQYREARNLALH